MVTLALAAFLVSGAVLMWPGASRAGALRSPPSGQRAPAQRRPPLRTWRRRRARAAALAEALAVLDAMAPALRAGLSPTAALAHLERTGVGAGGLVFELAAAAVAPRLGPNQRTRASPIGDVWSRLARTTGAAELDLVAAAWTLTDTAGVTLADAVDLGARLLRDTRARRSRLEVLLAGPRATMFLLTVLPVAGPLVGVLFGIDPVTFYAGSPLALSALCCGLALLVVGRLWCRALLRRARSARMPVPAA